MSDALFTGVSIFWLTQLIWIIFRPRPYMIWVQGVLLLMAFTIRYNGIYYPLIASGVLLLSGLRLWQRLAGIVLQILLIGGFVLYTKNQMKMLTGESQFSPFGGWQLANNALYMYGHTYREEVQSLPDKFKSLDTLVRRYFDSTRHVEDLVDYSADESGFYYSADDKSPLYIYMDRLYGQDTVFQNFKKWGRLGVMYTQYGNYLIREDPVAYVRYWIVPNSERYFYPPAEIFSKYSPYFLRQDEFGKIAKQLFDLRTLTVGWSLINFRTNLLSYYPLFFLLSNVFFILSFFGFFLLGGFKAITRENAAILISIGILWLCNLCFSITASCVVLRYQIFIMIVQFAFALVLAGFIVRADFDNSN